MITLKQEGKKYLFAPKANFKFTKYRLTGRCKICNLSRYDNLLHNYDLLTNF